MISFQVISDLHVDELDFTKQVDIHDLFTPVKSADYLIIAGDIGLWQLGRVKDFLNIIDEFTHYKKILYVAGNHEYYTDNPKYTYEFIRGQIFDFCNKTRKIVFLDNDDYRIPNTCCVVIGSTFWSIIPKESATWQQLPIYNQSRTSDSPTLVTADWITQRHEESRDAIKSIMHSYTSRFETENEELRPQFIVVTHYCPSFHGTLYNKHYSSPGRFFYCSKSDDLLMFLYTNGSVYSSPKKLILSPKDNQVFAWVYGHTHVNLVPDPDVPKKHYHRLITNQYKATNYNKEFVLATPFNVLDHTSEIRRIMWDGVESPFHKRLMKNLQY